jgi:hypothetical protein
LAAWLRLWNGRLDLLKETLHPQFRHVPADYPPLDRAGMYRAIEAVRSRYDVYKVTATLGPVTQDDMTCGQWRALAVAANETSHWVGNSILRLQDGLIIEHWEVSVQVVGEPFPLPG